MVCLFVLCLHVTDLLKAEHADFHLVVANDEDKIHH